MCHINFIPLFCLAFAAALAIGCSGGAAYTRFGANDDLASDTELLSFPRHYESLETDMGWDYLFGVLESTTGCLSVRLFPLPNAQASYPDSLLMLWPANYSVREEDGNIHVIDGNGTVAARVGDTIRASGDWWRDVPGELAESIPEACREPGHYWQVGDEVSIIDRDEPTAVAVSGSTLYFPRHQTRAGIDGMGIGLTLARGEGELALGGDCLRIGGEDGRIIVWPPGFTPHIEDGVIEVRNGGGKTIARVGDYLVIGGSAGSENTVTSGPCSGGAYWVNTSISSITRDGKKVWDSSRWSNK